MRRTKDRRREANKVLSNWVYMYNIHCIHCRGEHNVKQYIFSASWCFGTCNHFRSSISTVTMLGTWMYAAHCTTLTLLNTLISEFHNGFVRSLHLSFSSSISSSSILFFIQIWTTISSPALYTCMMMNRKSLIFIKFQESKDFC